MTFNLQTLATLAHLLRLGREVKLVTARDLPAVLRKRIQHILSNLQHSDSGR